MSKSSKKAAKKAAKAAAKFASNLPVAQESDLLAGPVFAVTVVEEEAAEAVLTDEPATEIVAPRAIPVARRAVAAVRRISVAAVEALKARLRAVWGFLAALPARSKAALRSAKGRLQSAWQATKARYAEAGRLLRDRQAWREARLEGFGSACRLEERLYQECCTLCRGVRVVAWDTWRFIRDFPVSGVQLVQKAIGFLDGILTLGKLYVILGWRLTLAVVRRPQQATVAA